MRECRFLYRREGEEQKEEFTTAKESEASPAGRRAGLTSETGCRSGTSENNTGVEVALRLSGSS